MLVNATRENDKRHTLCTRCDSFSYSNGRFTVNSVMDVRRPLPLLVLRGTMTATRQHCGGGRWELVLPLCGWRDQASKPVSASDTLLLRTPKRVGARWSISSTDKADAKPNNAAPACVSHTHMPITFVFVITPSSSSQGITHIVTLLRYPDIAQAFTIFSNNGPDSSCHDVRSKYGRFRSRLGYERNAIVVVSFGRRRHGRQVHYYS